MTILKKIGLFLWKYKDIIGLFLIIFLLYLLLTKPKDPIVVPMKDVFYEELIQEKAKNGRLVGIINQSVVTKDQLEKANDSLLTLLKVKPKHAKTITVYTNSIDTVFRDTTIRIVETQLKDTTFVAEYEDAWITQKAVVNKDSGRLYLAVRDTPVIVQVQKNPLFGKSTSSVKVYHSNPYIKTEEGYSYRLKVKEPILVIGPGLTYNPFNGNLVPGIQVTIPIIKIKR